MHLIQVFVLEKENTYHKLSNKLLLSVVCILKRRTCNQYDNDKSQSSVHTENRCYSMERNRSRLQGDMVTKRSGHTATQIRERQSN